MEVAPAPGLQALAVQRQDLALVLLASEVDKPSALYMAIDRLDEAWSP